MTQLSREGFMTMTLTVTGTLSDGTPFEGNDTITILRGGKGSGKNSSIR